MQIGEKPAKTEGTEARTTGQRRARSRPERRRRRRFVLAAAFIVLLAVFVGAFRYFRVDRWRRFDPALITGADRSLIITDSEGGVICVASGEQKRIPVPIKALSETTKFAFVSAEDVRFYEHRGIDIRRIFGAALADIKAGKLKEGASTIGQQLIKLSHLSGEKTFTRKLEEAYLTTRLEAAYSKDEILEMYLNFVYFGGGFYGIEAASLGYFGVHAADLSTAQAAQLAGILKAPSVYAPHLNPELSLARRNNILNLMRKYGHISAEECEEAKQEECVLANGIPEERTAFTEFAIREAAQKLGITRAELLRSGCTVVTTLDPAASSALSSLTAEDALFPSENAQTAAVILSRDGSIAAMCGGRTGGSFNRAADMERQPGSLIKPILCYAPALESGICTAATVLEDREKDFDGYAPGNAGGKYCGFVTVRRAVADSLNIPAVELLTQVGLQNAVAFAEKLGISFENEHIGLALALGGFTRGVSPLEMAGAYNAFNTDGNYLEPFAVREISRDGELLYCHAAQAVRAMGEGTAFIIRDILRTAAADGTASALSALGFPVAAKTGTNLDSDGGVRDVWTAAIAGEYTACVWFGTDDASLGCLPPGTTGGNTACVFIANLLAALPREKLTADEPPPAGVVSCRLDAEALQNAHAALLATEYTPQMLVISEYFTERTAPKEVSSVWLPPSPPREVGWYPDADGNPVICFTAEEARFAYRIFRCSAAGGGERLIAEVTGQTGQIGWTDHTAVPGESYFYWVVTVNPLIETDGAPAVSAESRRMRVVVLY